MSHSVRVQGSSWVFAGVALALAASPALARQRNGSRVPVCNAGPSQVVECTGVTTTVALNGTGSTNPLPGALTYRWEWCKNPDVTIDDSTSPTPNLFFDMLGNCQIQCLVALVVENANGGSACLTTVTVRDVTPPIIDCPSDVTVAPGAPTDPGNTGSASATDTCDPTPVVSHADDLTQLPDLIRRTWTADDGCQTSSCVQSIHVVEPPSEGPHFDIKPGSCPNPVNVNASGGAVVNIAMSLLGNDFDINQVDITSLAIERANFIVGSGQVLPYQIDVSDTGTPFVGEECDCHALAGDGTSDISMHFGHLDVVQILALDSEPNGAVIQIRLTGLLLDQSPFSAIDCVRIINNP